MKVKDKEMFKWVLKNKDPLEEELAEQILSLWNAVTKLSESVQKASDIIVQHNEMIMQIRQDLDYLALHTFKISEQQNQLIAHVVQHEMTDDDVFGNMESTAIH